MDLISLDDVDAHDVQAIFSLAGAPDPATPLAGTVAWSFEGRGIRTRASFLQAFRDLGLPFTELPDLLKTDERAEDLAGYLDPFFSLYVVRETDHERLAAFARASARPVINAMSGRGHPCEVLTDACYIDRSIRSLRSARIVLWGPTTNVFRSWHQLARVLDLSVIQVCGAADHDGNEAVRFVTAPPDRADVVITDRPASPQRADVQPLTLEHLQRMGRPALLPTPPFTVGGELGFDPTTYDGFIGHRQKAWLLPVQKAIVRHLLAGS